ncbi:ADP-ribosylglycohydrolase family protein [Pseudarthrobacter sp. PS3-L1]|uniref:ADP-ribosylglycohydrolase family protein n=1 Tax=Pseudarthrobacter sp. PS3-L1 TaxID=3046207 RepID=UPI0024B91137|nr:ADP-ribosylglycohydrolase family protein [Pseudarthrobacter sp. PS3-L1]MDJ0321608.1 ADP-ribosylglycohydrolase family protein [Pseudarthrobacter sp. PS3-L1]
MSNSAAGPAPSHSSRIYGCLLGGALGDALGYPVEQRSLADIRQLFGVDGLATLNDLAVDGGTPGFSDDTQLTLYTVDGLVEALEWANDGIGADVNACLWLAYLRWLATQGEPAPVHAPHPQPRWIDGQAVLRQRRGPGRACISGLATGEMGTASRPVNPQAKGCGTVMRSAPFGLIPHIDASTAARLSSDAASLTHGHPAARQASAAFSNLIHQLAAGNSLAEAAGTAVDYSRSVEAPAPEVAERLEAAFRLAATGHRGPEAMTEELGLGYVAEEALAIALYAALVTASGPAGQLAPADHFAAAVRLAVNHDGDSDSTGSLTGNILGALYGTECLPEQWLAVLDGQDTIRGVARQLVSVTVGPERNEPETP